MPTATAEKTVIGIDEVTEISGAASLDAKAPLRPEEAKRVWEIMSKRASRRQSGRTDVLVLLEDWATAEKYDIRDSHVLLVGRIENYSEKSYYLQGTFEIDMDELMDRDELSDGWITDIVHMVDETDNGASKEGESYLPKSAVQGVYVVAE